LHKQFLVTFCCFQKVTYNQIFIAIGECGNTPVVENFVCNHEFGSMIREVLDHSILLTEKQIQNILQEYFTYNNSKRPHQGLGKRTPNAYLHQVHERIQKISSVLLILSL
jgi:hypothetical protein